MKSYTTRNFRELLKSLPHEIQKQAEEAYEQFQADLNHPGLHFKKLRGSRTIHSVRIGSMYRALGDRNGDTITWFWIGSHAEYDEILKHI